MDQLAATTTEAGSIASSTKIWYNPAADSPDVGVAGSDQNDADDPALLHTPLEDVEDTPGDALLPAATDDYQLEIASAGSTVQPTPGPPEQQQECTAIPDDPAAPVAPAAPPAAQQLQSTTAALPRHICQQWIEAAKEGDIRELHKLHQQHPGLLNHQAGGLQCSALHWAAARGHSEAMQQLLVWGADPCTLTCTGCTPLHSAAAANRQECVELLLMVPDVQQQLESTNEDGLTAAALALMHGHKVVQGMLLQAAAAAGIGAAEASGSGLPYTSSGQPEQQQQRQEQRQHHPAVGMKPGFLLSSAARRQLPANPDSTSSHSSARSAGSAAADLCSAGSGAVTAAGAAGAAADAGSALPVAGAVAPQRVSGEQQTPIEVTDTIPQLASKNSSSTSANTGSSSSSPVDRTVGRAWLDAARAGDLASLQALLATHPQLLEYCGIGTSYALIGNSALHWAAAKGHVRIVQWLLQQGVQVHALLNQADATALHTAAGHGQAACAEVLVLVGGGDVHVLDGLGQSAVQAAAESGQQGLAHQLLLWDLVLQLAGSDRSCWAIHAMQQLLKLAGRSAEAAACVERQELQQLVQQLLDSRQAEAAAGVAARARRMAH